MTLRFVFNSLVFWSSMNKCLGVWGGKEATPREKQSDVPVTQCNAFRHRTNSSSCFPGRLPPLLSDQESV